MATIQDTPMTLEEHRRALHEDRKRRYREWHTAFLDYQRRFLEEMPQV